MGVLTAHNLTLCAISGHPYFAIFVGKVDALMFLLQKKDIAFKRRPSVTMETIIQAARRMFILTLRTPWFGTAPIVSISEKKQFGANNKNLYFKWKIHL